MEWEGGGGGWERERLLSDARVRQTYSISELSSIFYYFFFKKGIKVLNNYAFINTYYQEAFVFHNFTSLNNKHTLR